MKTRLKKISAWLLIFAMVLGMIPVTGRTVKAADTKKNVVVSVEGQTLSHGFYIEPTIVSFDEFINYWAEKGQTVAADDITAGGMIDYVLAQNGLTYNHGTTGSLQGPAYLSGIDGIRAGKGEAVVPDCLADDGITIRQVPGDDLYEQEYTGGAGWMFTDGDWMGDQAMGGHYFSQVGRPYTYNGETYYVIRLQVTIAGLGADLGHNEWGTSYGYTAADKSNLYILYANLDEAGILDKIPDTKEAVLAVINQLDASQAAVDKVYNELLDASQAEKPVFEDNLPKGALNYEVGDEADTLKVKATVNQGTLTYEWFKSTDKLSWTSLGDAGTENNRYTPSTDEAGTFYYKCVVTNNDEATGLSNTVESNIATVVCGISTPMFETDLDEAEKTYLTIDEAEALEVVATVSGDTELSYQWYKSTDKENWEKIAGADQESYTPDVSKVGTTYYKCIATNTKGNSQKSADSQVATITVKVDQPVFDTNLRTTTYSPNYDEECVLEVAASVKDGGKVTYQWYEASDAYETDLSKMTLIEGATGTSYSVDTSKPMEGRYYKVLATNTVQGVTASTFSNWSRVEVSTKIPYIEQDLKREMRYLVGEENPKALEIEASVEDDGELSYQWYESVEEEEPWDIYEMTPIEGETGTSYTPDTSKGYTAYYACRVTNTNRGQSEYEDSRICTVIVSCQQPVITKDLPDSVSYVAGEANPKALEIEASVEDGGTLSYQWYQKEGSAWSIDAMEAIAGATKANYIPDITRAGMTYACRVTNTKDGYTSFIDSNIVKAEVTCDAPEITKELDAKVVTYDQEAQAETLMVEAAVNDGGELSYQWYCGESENAMSPIEGATEASYTPSTEAAGTLCYKVVVTNTKAGITNNTDSAIAKIKVLAPQETISTEEELRAITANGNYILTADIELTSPWKQMKKFSGVLDGDGHVIRGVEIEDSDSNGVAFFHTTGIGAVIKNLGLEGKVTQKSWGTAASFVGMTKGDGLTISNCYANVEVNGNEWANVGGLVGKIDHSATIENSYFVGTLSGGTGYNAYAGGLAGQIYNSDVVIRNSYTTHNTAVGHYTNYNETETKNNYCASETDAHAAKIPTDMTEFLTALNEGNDAFVKDTGINAGYPILKWQEAEPEPFPGTEEGYWGEKTEAKVYDDFQNDIWMQYQQKDMKVGDTVSLRPWRVEQIVTNTITNDVARPTFHFEIVAGDSVSLDTESSDSKAVVTAVKPGTTVVKVTYDAMDYKEQHWDSISDVNIGYVVYTVGETGTADITCSKELKEWRHYDTIYYNEGETVPYTFDVSAEGAESVRVTLNGETVEGTDGKYTVNLENRSNIIGIEAKDADGKIKSLYRVIDARFVEVKVENKTNPEEALLKGDTATISFHGITMPVYKLATIYNPCMSGWGAEAAYVQYGNETLGSFKGQCKQWDLATNNDFDVTFDEAGSYTFTSADGIYCEWWGKELGADLTAEGSGEPGLGVPAYKGNFSKLPSFTVEVAEKEKPIAVEKVTLDKTEAELTEGESLELTATVLPENAANKNVTWSSSDETVAIVEEGKVTALKAGEAVITVTTEDGEFTDVCVVTVKEAEQPTDPEEPENPTDPEEPEVPEIITLINEKYGLQLTGKGLTSDMELVVTRLDVESDAVKAIRDAISSTKGVFALYDVKLMQDGEEIELPEEAKLSIPVGTKYNGMTMPVLLYADGKVKELSGTVKEGYMEVTVTELGGFGVVVDMNDPVNGNDGNGNQGAPGAGNAGTVKTGDDSSIAYMVWLMAACAVVVILSVKRRKNIR